MRSPSTGSGSSERRVDDWLALYREHIGPLYAFASRRVGGDRSLAEDVVQEVWLRALEAWRRRGVPTDVGAWLRTAAANLVRSHFRRHAPRDTTELEKVAAREGCAEGEPADQLVRALARVPRDQAELLARRYFDGESSSAIASADGLGARAIEGRLRRARKALARAVGGEDALRRLLSEGDQR